MVGRLASVDALRGIAILLVLVAHLPFSWSGVPSRAGELATTPAFTPLVEAVAGYGRFGVHLFLVVSGFCIHLRWARQRDPAATVDFVPFWRRRLVRLYPPYLAALLASFAGLFILYGAIGGSRALPQALGYDSNGQLAADAGISLALLQNVTDAARRLGNTPLWTLALEEQLYLLYFPLLLLRRRLGWPVTLVVVALVTLGWRAVPLVAQDLPATWNMLGPARWIEWTLGALLVEAILGVVALPPWLRSWPLAGGMLAAAVIANLPGQDGPATALVGDLAFGAAFFVLANAFISSVRDGGSPGWLARLGLFSYSVYLTHEPVVVATKQLALRLGLSAGEAATIGMTGLRLAAALLVGYVFYRIIELPAIRASRRLGGVIVRVSPRQRVPEGEAQG